MPANTRLTPFQLDNGEAVWVEVQELPVAPEGADIVPASRSGAARQQRLQQAVDGIRPAAEAVLDALREFNSPQTVELEIAIGFSGKVGAFIASADSSASFKVKLGWQNPHPTPAAET
jgi:hypothetical protein